MNPFFAGFVVTFGNLVVVSCNRHAICVRHRTYDTVSAVTHNYWRPVKRLPGCFATGHSQFAQLAPKATRKTEIFAQRRPFSECCPIVCLCLFSFRVFYFSVLNLNKSEERMRAGRWVCALILSKGCYKVFKREFIDIKCRIYGTLSSNTFYNFARAHTHRHSSWWWSLVSKYMSCILLYS